MTENISKAQTLAHLDVEKAFEQYLRPFFGNAGPKPGLNISNPFQSKKQKTPSFNYYKTPTNEWRFNDFSTDDSGDVFELVKRLNHCDFNEAKSIIVCDFSLGQTTEQQIDHSHFDVITGKYWSDLGISLGVLKKYKVRKVKSYKRGAQHFVLDEKKPTFSYEVSYNCFKLYTPNTIKMKFSWLGNKPSDYVFGEKQLPMRCDRIYITGGEKDVLSLANIGENAVCFNSETAMPSNDVIERLKEKSENIVVFYDKDETGLKQSEKLARRFNLGRLVIPDNLVHQGEKDISDVLKNRNSLKGFSANVEYYQEASNCANYIYMDQILNGREFIRGKVANKIVRPKPILSMDGEGFLYPRSINIIQGQAGVHKSRLAETMCSALISNSQETDAFLGFKRATFSRPKVCYIDTERNLSDQYPYSLQQILSKAGYERTDIPDTFDFISILQFKREDRFAVVNEYLKYLRKDECNQLVIVLDVITDCIRDFNRSDDSMQLIDLMNSAINEHDVTFIALIHENPGSGNKARGHLGTELMNKASTVMKIGFELDKSNQPTELLKVNFLKTRASKKLAPVYLKFCEHTKGLVHAEENDINDVVRSRQVKADIHKVIKYLEDNYQKKIQGVELIQDLVEEFVCSDKIIRERLKEIIDNEFVIQPKNELPKKLVKIKEGKNIFYAFQDKK
ncbi:MAG: bifunctional DNA primase/helicase [Crocinitomicaceae bacterium]|nr:bifunctional DNA primase/helicase [Crocinitomicaceae bacterium]